MELRRHDIVRMAGKDCNALARGAVPYANRLVVGSGKLTRTFGQAGRD